MQDAQKGIRFSRALNFGITGPTQVFLDARVLTRENLVGALSRIQ